MAGEWKRTKSIEQSIRDTEDPEHQLKKNLIAFDLIAFGIGVCIGSGTFVLTGHAAATNAGPSITLVFLIAGVACALGAVCYAEFASTVRMAAALTRSLSPPWASCWRGSSAGISFSSSRSDSTTPTHPLLQYGGR